MSFKLLSIVLAVVSMAALGLGGTLAYFSDIETSTGNTMTAGSLDLAGGAGIAPATIGNVAPGDSGEIDWTLTNSGSVAGAMVTMQIKNLVDDENSLGDPESAEAAEAGHVADGLTGELSANVDVVITADADNNGSFETAVAAGKLNALAAVYTISPIAASPTGIVPVKVAWSIATSVGNVIQSDSSVFDVEFNLYQSYP